VTAACGGTPYEPARSPRIALVANGYVRDGKKYERGFGGGGIDVVAGNPRAEREATRGRDLVVGGFVVSIAGIVTESVGAGLLVSDLDKDDQGRLRTSTRGNVGFGLVFGGAAVGFIGAYLMGDGQSHLYDAINIYNDGLSAPPPIVPASQPIVPASQPIVPAPQPVAPASQSVAPAPQPVAPASQPAVPTP
jgi:hypothetical protein